MSNVIKIDFDGQAVAFTEDGWINATTAAKRFGKRIQDYLDNMDTATYATELACQLNHSNQRDLIRAYRGRGGGTWLHPKLAVHFGRWLDTRFAVWCDLQIDELLRTGQRQAMSVYQELVALQLEDAGSLARASFGSHLMLDRKREKPEFQRRRLRLEAEAMPQLFAA